MTCLSSNGREMEIVDGTGVVATTTATAAAGGSSSSASNAVLDIERQHIVEEAERRCRGELEQMRREIDTLKESLRDQVDSEDVR